MIAALKLILLSMLSASFKSGVRVRYAPVPASRVLERSGGVHTRTALHSVSSRVLFRYGGGEELYGGGCRTTCREGAELG